ncbi:MAG: GFA family protein [Sulfitobacter sp.]
MQQMVRHAQCLCGAVTAETRGEPWRVMSCSCRDCRRKSGSAFSVSTYWAAEAVTLAGNFQTWQRPCPDGRTLTYYLCPTCGVSLYWKADFAGDRIGIGAGNFDDCNFAVPRKAFWTEGRPDWVHEIGQIPALKRQ